MLLLENTLGKLSFVPAMAHVPTPVAAHTASRRYGALWPDFVADYVYVRTVVSTVKCSTPSVVRETMFAICWHGVATLERLRPLFLSCVAVHSIQTLTESGFGDKTKKPPSPRVYSFLSFSL